MQNNQHNQMFVALEMLLDGTPESAIDWLVAGALATHISFDQLQAKTTKRYVRIKTTILSTAQTIHKGRQAVKQSLLRLQDQGRIQLVNDTQKGVNYILINIGLDTRGKHKTKVLFAPMLTPDWIYNCSVENAKEAKDPRKRLKHLKQAYRALERTNHPERQQRLDTLNARITEWEAKTGGLTEPSSFNADQEVT